MNVLLDTNVLLSAYIGTGVCDRVFGHCLDSHPLVTSQVLVEEFRRKLLGKFRLSLRSVDSATVLFFAGMRIVEPVKLSAPVCRDPDDDHVLGTALAGGCHCIVTGDRDLLVLGSYEGVAIIRPADFWAFEADQQG